MSFKTVEPSRQCANTGCQNTSRRKYCEACYFAHRAKLPKNCKTDDCPRKIDEHQTYCSQCQPNFCLTCSEPCKKMYCNDCTIAYKRSQLTSSRSSVNNKTSPTPTIATGTHLDSCSLKDGTLTLEPCTECAVRLCRKCESSATSLHFCQSCDEEFNEAKAQNRCPDCGLNVAPGTVYCWRCIKAFKMKPKKCRDCGDQTTTGTYCSDCKAAYRASQQ